MNIEEIIVDIGLSIEETFARKIILCQRNEEDEEYKVKIRLKELKLEDGVRKKKEEDEIRRNQENERKKEAEIRVIELECEANQKGLKKNSINCNLIKRKNI